MGYVLRMGKIFRPTKVIRAVDFFGEEMSGIGQLTFHTHTHTHTHTQRAVPACRFSCNCTSDNTADRRLAN